MAENRRPDYFQRIPEHENSRNHPIGKILHDLYYTWNNNIPPFQARSDVVGKNYFKVQKAWWQSVTGLMEYALEDDLISDPAVKRLTQKMINRYQTPDFTNRWTGSYDLKLGHAVTDLVLRSLARL